MKTNDPVILAVDDNPTNLDVLSDFLSEDGFEILFALDGESALERAKLAKPDLILLDVLMPRLDGFEVCRRLKNDDITKEIPIIFMTALSDTVNKVHGFELGAVDYITKPIQAEEVIARVKTHLKLQKLQRDLQERNEQLSKALESEKELNELKTRFISMVSHEFRTPLTTISSSSEIIKRYTQRLTEEKKVEHLDRIQANVHRMTDLLDDVLLLSRAESGKIKLNLSSLNLKKFCQELVEEMQLTYSDYTINFDADESCYEGEIDERLLRHISSNLLSNAIKYSAKENPIDFVLRCDGKNALLEIKDQGIGIPKKDQKYLFDSFHRAGNVGSIQGTGLGLTIVKRSVEMHGGKIEFNSEENVGTTFMVTLPLKPSVGEE